MAATGISDTMTLSSLHAYNAIDCSRRKLSQQRLFVGVFYRPMIFLFFFSQPAILTNKAEYNITNTCDSVAVAILWRYVYDGILSNVACGCSPNESNRLRIASAFRFLHIRPTQFIV